MWRSRFVLIQPGPRAGAPSCAPRPRSLPVPSPADRRCGTSSGCSICSGCWKSSWASRPWASRWLSVGGGWDVLRSRGPNAGRASLDRGGSRSIREACRGPGYRPGRRDASGAGNQARSSGCPQASNDRMGEPDEQRDARRLPRRRRAVEPSDSRPALRLSPDRPNAHRAHLREAGRVVSRRASRVRAPPPLARAEDSRPPMGEELMVRLAPPARVLWAATRCSAGGVDSRRELTRPDDRDAPPWGHARQVLVFGHGEICIGCQGEL